MIYRKTTLRIKFPENETFISENFWNFLNWTENSFLNLDFNNWFYSDAVNFIFMSMFCSSGDIWESQISIVLERIQKKYVIYDSELDL